MKLFKLVILAVFFTTTVNAQLADFTLTVTKTDESCPGNGSLTFNATNLTPGASVIYSIYLLPNTQDPIAVTTENNLGSLSAGTYRVIATQSLGNQSNTEQQDITINDVIVDFNFSVSSANTGCSSGASIIIQATSGTFAQAQIISGPVTRPLQTSNVFDDLPPGTYNIRAFDICGFGKVKTYTLTLVDNTPSISASFYPQVVLNSCDSATVSNTVTVETGTLVYPLTVEYVVHIPGEPDQVITETYTSGAPTTIDVSAVLPLEDGVSYVITLTDGCGDSVTSEENILEPEISLTLSPGEAPCAERYLILNASQFVNSFTVNFLTFPAGFDPAAFNPTPFGPFTTGVVAYGSETNTIPFGTYEVEITDECGRTQQASVEIEFIPLEPAVTTRNNGCFSLFGRIRISVPNQMLVSATIISAPATYTPTLPQDVTQNINDEGGLVLNEMPVGVYVIEFTDDCGFTYTREVEVPEFVERDFEGEATAACEPGYGGVTISSGNGALTSVIITSAPAVFTEPLPYDASANIVGGDFYMTDLPDGTYVFEATDICGIVTPMTIEVEGYNPAPQDERFVFDPGCGSFAVTVTDTSNGTMGATYWLQRFNPVTGTWGHPGTGNPYPEGTVPTNGNSIRLANNTPRNNLAYSGLFRIVKIHQSFASGSEDPIICIDELYSGTFVYTEELDIDAAYTLACAGQPNDVFLQITGFPTSIRIIEMNGEPFVVDNGTDPLFTDLEPAEYTFLVEDACGNAVPQSFNLQSLPSLTVANDPGDMIECVEPGNVGPHEFNLADQNPGILGEQTPAVYTITYHISQADADAGNNPLPLLYTNTTNGQTIYARLVHNAIDLCYDTVSFNLYVGETPLPQITTTGVICNEGTVQLTAQAGFESYVWSTGETTRTIIVSEPGTYTVTVGRTYGDTECPGSNSVEVSPSSAPTIVNIDTTDWTRNDNTITVTVEGIGNYEYSLDGENYQAENVFTGLGTGIFQVYVRDINGCGQDIEEVVLMYYPNFFTPNGDGTNERWRIEFSQEEPNLNVSIFDRYGKLLINFGPNYEGWDGTYNGNRLPATDYWFLVTREDGRQHKGHFSLIR